MTAMRLRAKNPPRRWPEVNHTVPHLRISSDGHALPGKAMIIAQN